MECVYNICFNILSFLSLLGISVFSLIVSCIFLPPCMTDNIWMDAGHCDFMLLGFVVTRICLYSFKYHWAFVLGYS